MSANKTRGRSLTSVLMGFPITGVFEGVFARSEAIRELARL
jgi:hypothetical protein